MVGISLSEILRVAEEEEVKNVQLTAKQEEALFADHALFRILWLLTVEEKSIENISKLEKIAVDKIKKYILKLENLDLIKVGKGNRIRSAQKGLYRWASNGKLLRKLNYEWSHETLRKVLEDLENPKNLHRLSYLKLSIESREKFYADLNELINQYARLSNREKADWSGPSLSPVSVLVAISQSEFLS